MTQKIVLTAEEKAAHKRESQRRYIEKKKAAANNINIAGVPNYEQMYKDLQEQLTAAQNKNLQYESLIKSYAEATNKAQMQLKQATLEYNARIQYMLDCAKHSYISMQFAASSAKDTSKGETND